MKQFAFVFPGQGSQAVGMLDVWSRHPIVGETLREASDALREDIGKLIREGPSEALALTTNTQPAMLVAGVAMFRVWMSEFGVAPNIVAGHSLGEYAALVAAGSLTLAQAVPLVRFRAQAMQDAVPVGSGAMAAILGLDAVRVTSICAEVTLSFALGSGEVVEAVNFNDPTQTVIAGSKLAVDKACEQLKTAGARRTLLLPVSGPFHSSLMQPAAQALKQRMELIKFSTPQIALVNNIDAAVEYDVVRIRDALYRQAFGPVRWVQCIQAIKLRGITTLAECGPGKVLTSLVKRIDPEMIGVGLFDPASLQELRGVLA